MSSRKSAKLVFYFCHMVGKQRSNDRNFIFWTNELQVAVKYCWLDGHFSKTKYVDSTVNRAFRT